MSERDAGVRAVLLVLGTVLVFGGLIASVLLSWHLATFLCNAAFLCKSIECWLLDSALTEKRSETTP